MSGEKIRSFICPACGNTGKVKIAGSCSCGDPDCAGGMITDYTKTIEIVVVEDHSLLSCAKCGALMDPAPGAAGNP